MRQSDVPFLLRTSRFCWLTKKQWRPVYETISQIPKLSKSLPRGTRRKRRKIRAKWSNRPAAESWCWAQMCQLPSRWSGRTWRALKELKFRTNCWLRPFWDAAARKSAKGRATAWSANIWFWQFPNRRRFASWRMTERSTWNRSRRRWKLEPHRPLAGWLTRKWLIMIEWAVALVEWRWRPVWGDESTIMASLSWRRWSPTTRSWPRTWSPWRWWRVSSSSYHFDDFASLGDIPVRSRTWKTLKLYFSSAECKRRRLRQSVEGRTQWDWRWLIWLK